MTRTLKLQLPDKVYRLVLEKAKEFGQTPEQFASDCLKKNVGQVTEDPLLKLAGVFESDLPDVAERHDDYIGQNLRNHHE